MRAHIAIASVAALLIWSQGMSAQTVRPPTDTVTRILTRAARVRLVNAVLRARSEEFEQKLLISSCSLDRLVGPGGNVDTDIDPAYRTELLPQAVCPATWPENVPSVGEAVIVFQSLRYERSELVMSGPVLPFPRPSGLVVVSLWVKLAGSRAQDEEWVMDQDGHLLTIRVFGFLVAWSQRIVPIVPVQEGGATDGLFFRYAGIPVYGGLGIPMPVDEQRMHGNDERIPVESFRDGVAFASALMRQAAGVAGRRRRWRA